MQEIGNREKGIAGVVAAFAVCVGVWGQNIQGLPSADAAKRGHVTYAAEPVDVAAGKPAVVELRFRVEDGYHVNSHTPKDELLIPTVLKLDDAAGTKVLGAEYPKGTSFHFAIGDGETLDVYQGEFRVRLRVVVPKGQSTLTGGLRYQACDNAACFPPKTLPVTVAVTGK